MIADDLAGETHTGKPTRTQHVFLGGRHGVGLPFDELHAARRAPRVPAAGVQLIDVDVLFEREHEALTVFHLDRGITFNRQFGHRVIIVNSATPNYATSN